MNYLRILFELVALHCLLDYAGQGDFMSRAKSPRAPVPGVPWRPVLMAHACIHAGGVFLVTHSLILAALEYVLHYALDFMKCNGDLGAGEQAFALDQNLHFACKVVWAAAIFFWPGLP